MSVIFKKYRIVRLVVATTELIMSISSPSPPQMTAPDGEVDPHLAGKLKYFPLFPCPQRFGNDLPLDAGSCLSFLFLI